MKKTVITITLIIAVTLLIIAVIVFGFADLPNVVGNDNFDAKATLEEAGFTYNEGLRYSDTVEAGKVITQSPQSTRAFRLIPVLCEVSVGPNRNVVRVPPVEGVPVLEGIYMLLDANLGYSLTTREDDKAPRGQIMRQNIRAEAMIQRHTPIKLEVNARDMEDILSMMGNGFTLVNGEIVFAEKNERLYDLKDAIEQADGRISNFVTLPFTIHAGETLNVPSNIILDFRYDEENDAFGITIEKGGTLIIDGVTLISADGTGLLEIESGSITFKPWYGRAVVINGNVNIPAGKHFTCPDEFNRFNVLIVETGLLTVYGTLTMDGTDEPDSGFMMSLGGAVIVAADATVELLRGGSISDVTVFRPGAILTGDESIVYTRKITLDGSIESEEFTGFEGISKPGTYIFDGTDWIRKEDEEEEEEVLE